jgi:hypothetical protein
VRVHVGQVGVGGGTDGHCGACVRACVRACFTRFYADVCAQVKDSDTGEFNIEAGALMLADNGICCACARAVCV